MSSYKLEVENTERLKTDINSAFTDINTELKKDDDIDISNLKDIAPAIEQLKNSRKRWASGEGFIKKIDGVWTSYFIDISSLTFDPNIVLCRIDFGKENTSDLVLKLGTTFREYNFINDRYTFPNSMSFNKDGDLGKLEVFDSSSSQIKNNLKNITWYAFE